MPEKSQLDILGLLDEIKLTIIPIVKSNQKWWEKLGKIAEIVTPKIEDVAKEWKGADKKEVAMRIIDQIWFEHFDIKYIPNVFEKPLVSFVASKTIDAVVSNFNKIGVFKHS